MTVPDNIQKLRILMEKHGLDAFYVSGFDIYLNEHIPMEDCPRYFLTNFSGSTGQVLVTKDQTRLYVDGRYHEQVDNQCHHLVHTVKCPFNVPTLKALQDDIISLGITSLGLELSRLPFVLFQTFEKLCRVTGLKESPFVVNHPTPGRVSFIDTSFTGKDHGTKIKELLKEDEALFTGQLDFLSWILNLRGFQLPYHSVVKAKALIYRNRVALFVPRDSKIDDAVRRAFHIVTFSGDNYESSLKEELEGLEQKYILFNPLKTTALDAQYLAEFFKGRLKENREMNAPQSVKNAAEICSFESSFEKAGRAIFKTLSWLKEKSSVHPISELDYFNKTGEYYHHEGAKSQSFKTIAGFGKNSSLIHYGDPKPDYYLKEGDIALLDSGGIFEEGLATDCTRTVIGYGRPNPKQKLIYTLVLIGLLRVHHSSFKRGTQGRQLDALARREILAHGFNYAHGTGHGVGVNVHEDGYLLGPVSRVPLEEGKVGSIEPGIYIPNFGGVRLEDVAVVEKDPEKKGYLRFRNFVFIGFDHGLIDLALMTNEEKMWLFDYEKKCAEKGRSFLHA